jgi:hypothetical protein
MDSDSAHRSSWKIAEVVYGIPFLLAIALQIVVPFPLLQGILRPLGISHAFDFDYDLPLHPNYSLGDISGSQVWQRV